MVAISKSVEQVAAMTSFIEEILRGGHVVHHMDNHVRMEVDVPDWIFEAFCMQGVEFEDAEDDVPAVTDVNDLQAIDAMDQDYLL